ncbi:MAG: hypothetical protein AB1714_20230 [Acidobacteriota bacterium]
MPRITRPSKRVLGKPGRSSKPATGVRSGVSPDRENVHVKEGARQLLQMAREVAGLLAAGGYKHAWCGAVGMAIYGAPRASADVDLIIEPEAVDALRPRLRELGYAHEPGEIRVARGRIRIRRFVRLVPDADPEVLDFLIADPGSVCERALQNTVIKEVSSGERFRVLGLGAFADLKSLSERPRDLEDAEILRSIQRLKP